METSSTLYKALGAFLVIAAIVIQSCVSISGAYFGFEANVYWYISSLILLFAGSVMLVSAYSSRLFAFNPKSNYAIMLIGFVGMIVLFVVGGYLGDLLPEMAQTTLMLDMFWTFLLGLISKGFLTNARSLMVSN